MKKELEKEIERLAKEIERQVDKEVKRQCPWYDGTFLSILKSAWNIK